MRIISLVLYIWTLMGFLFLFFTSTNSHTRTYVDSEPQNDPSITYEYDRLDEVKRACRSVLSSASELNPDDNRVYRIRNELSLSDGDWWQEADKAPLMPFDDRERVNFSQIPSPQKLVSFWVMNVNPVRQSKKMISISGLLLLGITRGGSFSRKTYAQSPQFQIWPGSSQLTLSFQGFYTESQNNRGERIMCLLGNAMLPSRQPDSTDPRESENGFGPNYHQPSLLQDDQILLVLRYPKTFTLTRRVVRGEMKSLNLESNPKFFDKVLISSQLGPNVNYEFGSETLVSKACDPYPYRDELVDNGIDIYKGDEFCEIVQRFTSGEAFTVIPNWRCNNTDEYCSKLGPFMSGKEIKATDGGFNNVRLFMQDVRCEPGIKEYNGSFARVSAVFGAVPTIYELKSVRTGLGNMTLPAEGIWKSSSGQLCMVGCLGISDSEVEKCESRICLYVPISFSIKQRGVIIGSISSITNGTDSYFPLSFEKLVQPSELWNLFSSSHITYKYSKIKLAGAFLERSESFDFGAVIKKSFLKYPTLEDGPAFMDSLIFLSEDLTLHISAVSDPLPKVHPSRTYIQMEILSLGPLFLRYWSSGNDSFAEGKAPFHPKVESTERQLLMNVSAQLSVTENLNSNISLLFLEGLYDPLTGKMYLIGCRDVRASWKILFQSMDLEGGMDCLIEVKIEYPPKTARWLINPIAKFSIASQRTEDDPLYFSPVYLKSLPILYRRQREDILSRRGIEGVLRILTLQLAITGIISQLFYIRNKVDDVPYTSLVMLGVQALGYSLPLITGAEALFKKMASESDEIPSYDLGKNLLFHAIDFMVKLLLLLVFLLTLRLFQKVWKSRIRLLTRTPLEPGRVPSDRPVLFTSLVIHAIGFSIVLVIHTVKARERPLQTEKYMDSRGHTYSLREWEIELEEYLGLVQDFFLFPQIIGNFLWQIRCKPLRKFYYFGITVVRLLPHVYDYIRVPVFNPYFSEEYEFVNPSLDFYSKFGDIAIPVTAILLSIIVYIQQRWSYEELSQKLNKGKYKLLPLGSRVYERLPSKSFEAELASGVNETVVHEREHEDE